MFFSNLKEKQVLQTVAKGVACHGWHEGTVCLFGTVYFCLRDFPKLHYGTVIGSARTTGVAINVVPGPEAPLVPNGIIKSRESAM